MRLEQAIRLPTMCAQSQKEPIECKLLKRLSNSEDWLKGPILEKQRSPADATLTNGLSRFPLNMIYGLYPRVHWCTLICAMFHGS
ncbi:hypothetical protein EYC84_003097 [Monilinia fructicola]|uniref:Uncharacterized protein n=1 Tax=Monilinia fructicola TaxID=38448 RepID=A0A5M9JUW9_MONFR|nr:hypothetical protein EYC84_003097 [Monilinia fructicola]